MILVIFNRVMVFLILILFLGVVRSCAMALFNPA